MDVFPQCTPVVLHCHGKSLRHQSSFCLIAFHIFFFFHLIMFSSLTAEDLELCREGTVPCEETEGHGWGQRRGPDPSPPSAERAATLPLLSHTTTLVQVRRPHTWRSSLGEQKCRSSSADNFFRQSRVRLSGRGLHSNVFVYSRPTCCCVCCVCVGGS